jgi:hypothetical protein
VDTSSSPKTPLRKILVYEIRLVRARRALCLAEPTVTEPDRAIRTLHSMMPRKAKSFLQREDETGATSMARASVDCSLESGRVDSLSGDVQGRP